MKHMLSNSLSYIWDTGLRTLLPNRIICTIGFSLVCQTGNEKVFVVNIYNNIVNIKIKHD